VADSFTIDVDDLALLEALTTMPDAVMVFLKPAARITADNIAREAKSRVARRTGKTADAITVEEARSGDGYVVFVANAAADWPNLDIGLEFGTKFMSKRPFLFVSAQLEEGAHDRRSRDAIKAAIDSKGLGD
jgi:hypothetical protein